MVIEQGDLFGGPQAESHMDGFRVKGAGTAGSHHGNLAVSYTHLDVYKRQILEISRALFGWRRGSTYSTFTLPLE